MHRPNYDQSRKYAIWEEAPANHLWHKTHLYFNEGGKIHDPSQLCSAAIMFTRRNMEAMVINPQHLLPFAT